MPNNKNIKAAIDLVFHNVSYFYSCFNIINKLYHYLPYSYSNNIFNYLNKIYLSKDIDEFNLRKNDLFIVYNASPFVIDILNKELDSFSLFLNYPLFLRKHIISFYFIREFMKSLSSASHRLPYFYNLDQFVEKIIPNIKSFESKMYCSKNEWNSIISYLYTDHKELLLCVL